MSRNSRYADYKSPSYDDDYEDTASDDLPQKKSFNHIKLPPQSVVSCHSGATISLGIASILPDPHSKNFMLSSPRTSEATEGVRGDCYATADFGDQPMCSPGQSISSPALNRLSSTNSRRKAIINQFNQEYLQIKISESSPQLRKHRLGGIEENVFEEVSVDDSYNESPFTKFLTEENRRINQQCASEVQQVVLSPPLPSVIHISAHDVDFRDQCLVSPITHEGSVEQVDITALQILNENRSRSGSFKLQTDASAEYSMNFESSLAIYDKQEKLKEPEQKVELMKVTDYSQKQFQVPRIISAHHLNRSNLPNKMQLQQRLRRNDSVPDLITEKKFKKDNSMPKLPSAKKNQRLFQLRLHTKELSEKRQVQHQQVNQEEITPFKLQKNTYESSENTQRRQTFDTTRPILSRKLTFGNKVRRLTLQKDFDKENAPYNIPTPISLQAMNSEDYSQPSTVIQKLQEVVYRQKINQEVSQVKSIKSARQNCTLRKRLDRVNNQNSQKATERKKNSQSSDNMPNWKKQSIIVRRSMGVSVEARSLQLLSLQLDDRILCDFCGRKFDARAADKHISLCADQAKRNIILRKSSQRQLGKVRVEPPKIIEKSSNLKPKIALKSIGQMMTRRTNQCQSAKNLSIMSSNLFHAINGPSSRSRQTRLAL